MCNQPTMSETRSKEQIGKGIKFHQYAWPVILNPKEVKLTMMVASMITIKEGMHSSCRSASSLWASR